MHDLIVTILESPITLVIGRIVLTILFWSAGIFGLFNFSAVVQEMNDAELPAPKVLAAATIACQLIGSALVIGNPGGFGWIGAGALGVFTLLSIPLGHPFWKYEEPRRTPEFHLCIEHVTVVGGLILAAILSI